MLQHWFLMMDGLHANSQQIFQETHSKSTAKQCQSKESSEDSHLQKPRPGPLHFPLPCGPHVDIISPSLTGIFPGTQACNVVVEIPQRPTEGIELQWVHRAKINSSSSRILSVHGLAYGKICKKTPISWDKNNQKHGFL